MKKTKFLYQKKRNLVQCWLYFDTKNSKAKQTMALTCFNKKKVHNYLTSRQKILSKAVTRSNSLCFLQLNEFFLGCAHLFLFCLFWFWFWFWWCHLFWHKKHMCLLRWQPTENHCSKTASWRTTWLTLCLLSQNNFFRLFRLCGDVFLCLTLVLVRGGFIS